MTRAGPRGATEELMPSQEERTISLPPEQARYIDTLVASGAYESVSEVVQAGLDALLQQEETVEKWLREEVLPVAADMEADPGRAIPAEQVFAEIRALHEERLKNRRS